MHTRLHFVLLSSALLSLPLAACGDDGNTTDASTSVTGSTGDGSTGGGSTGGATTESPTTGSTSDGTTGDDPNPSTSSASTDATSDGSTGGGSTGGGSTGDTTGGGGALSWEKDVYPAIVAGTCGCHGGGSGGLTMTSAMDSYTNIVGVDATQVPGFKRVAPGDPTNSYFLAKVAGTAGMAPFNSGSPSQMPKGGAPKDQVAIDLLTQWIADGANP